MSLEELFRSIAGTLRAGVPERHGAKDCEGSYRRFLEDNVYADRAHESPPYRVCVRCVMDITDPDIVFVSLGSSGRFLSLIQRRPH
jgi:hypothetical protein